ncbi:MAG: Rrf2 family transcriptional regulator [Burkholderiales bacterium]|nr:Rrf2 family transcriptional regulator [Burkholderiales bacterium]
MKLTQWSDYCLRVLMYCAACSGRERPVTIGEIAEAHAISRSHLTKVVMSLAAQGWLETTRGRGGGLRLAQPAHAIRVGAVLRAAESDFTLVECFEPASSTCLLDGRCRLKAALERALASFLAELDSVTIDDLVQPAPAGGSRSGAAPLTFQLSPALPQRAAARRR